MVDNHERAWAPGRLELEPEFLLDGGENGGTTGIGGIVGRRRRRRVRGAHRPESRFLTGKVLEVNFEPPGDARAIHYRAIERKVKQLDEPAQRLARGFYRALRAVQAATQQHVARGFPFFGRQRRKRDLMGNTSSFLERRELGT